MLFEGGIRSLPWTDFLLNIPLFMIQQANPTIFASVFSIGTNDRVPGTNIASDWRFGIDPLPTNPPPQTQLCPVTRAE